MFDFDGLLIPKRMFDFDGLPIPKRTFGFDGVLIPALSWGCDGNEGPGSTQIAVIRTWSPFPGP